MKVIIADDEKIAREGLKETIDWAAFNMEVVYCAKDGKEALSYIKENDVDVLITDIKMPEMDGIELIKNISLLNKKINIIILSGYSDFTYAQKAIRYGVSNYLLKPVHLEELEDILTKIKEKHQDGVSRIYVDENEKERYDKNDRALVRNEIEVVKQLFVDHNKNDIEKCLNNIYLIMNNNAYPITLYKQVSLKNINKIIQFVQNELDYELTYFNDTERLMDITMSESFDEIKEKTKVFFLELYDYYYKVAKENIGSLVYNVKRIVGDRYNDKNLTLNEISEELDVTPNYLGKLFKDETNIAFSDYIENIRMDKACELIKQTNLKVYEIAEMCGYNDGQYFAKAFKKYTGKTPLEYRRESVEKYTK